MGVIVPEISNSFFGTLFSGIEEITNKNGLSLLYCSNEDNEKKDSMALDLMRTQRVRGVLYVPAANYPAMGKKKKVQKELENLGCPVICIDRDIALPFDTIHFDDRTAVKNAVIALAKAGHQKIAVINGNHESNVLASERYKGYLDGLREAGLEIREELIYQGTYKQSYAYLAAKEIFQKQDQPTAVLTCNNSLGKGYLQAVREDGKTDSYTHVSLDKIEMLDLLGIPHNYIERDSYELGKRAAELLINRIAFPEKRIQNILLKAPLIRETF